MPTQPSHHVSNLSRISGLFRISSFELRISPNLSGPIMQNKPNPTAERSEVPMDIGKPNSELTSITEMTYNRSRYAKAALAEGQSRPIGNPNQTNLTNPDDHPSRSANKQTKRPTENPPK